MQTRSNFWAATLACLSLASAANSAANAAPASAATSSATSTAATDVSPAIAAAIADPARPDADKQRDANRKPAETLSFAGVRAGDHVGELFPGGGYFTRLLSKTVGPSGHVYGLAPPRAADAPANLPDFAAGVKAVAADPAYANVSVVLHPLADISFPEPLDLVWTTQNYHDLHNVPDLDVVAFDRRVFAALKPGGIFFVLDHVAAPGSGDRDTKTLHRIDPETVKREAQTAGFVFVGSSNSLQRADDPHTANVFDPLIRGKTDQFMLKFRKP